MIVIVDARSGAMSNFAQLHFRGTAAILGGMEKVDTQKTTKDECPRCEKEVRLTEAGRLFSHVGATKSKCSMSGRYPR